MKPKYNFLRSSFLPAHIALSLGLALAGISSQSARAANTGDVFNTTATDLSVGTNYAATITPTAATTTDVQLSGSYGTTTLSINGGALSFGTLNDIDTTQNLVITNSNATAGSITLNTASNSTAGSSASDLLYVQAGANLAVQSGTGTLTLNFVNNGNIDNAGTLSLAGPLNITAAKVITFTGAGATTVSGSVANTSGAITINDAGGSVTFSGANANTGTTTITAGTLKLGASNALSTTGNVTLGTGGITNIFDLAGYSQTIGLLASGGTTDSAGIITSSAAGGSLTINEGNTNANTFGGTRFTGTLALTVVGSNPGGNVQMTNANNTFSGGLTIKSSNAGSLTTANLATAGGLTGNTNEGVRYNAPGVLGTGTITLDNGQIFGITGTGGTTANNIVVTTRGGVIHNETNTAVFSGTLGSTGSTLLVMNSNSGNSNTPSFTGDDSGFSGTIAIDTTNIGGIKFSGSALGNSSTNLLWFGNGANGGTGTVSAADATSKTYTFGEWNNLNSGSVGSTMSGKIQNTITATTATFSIGDSNATAATFQGVIQNGTGTVALTKTGTNTQILSGASTYTGATTINGGTLQITGSLASGSAVAINNNGTLIAGTGGTVAGSVAVNGGGSLGGTGTVSGAVTVASGSASATQGKISLVDGGVGTLTVSNAAGLTLGGTAGNLSLLNFEANSSSSDLLSLGSHVLTVGAGGANITITSLGVVAGNTYNLMSFGSGAGAGFATGSGATTIGGLTLTNPSLSFGVSGTLTVTSTAVQLVTTGSSAPASAYWSGAKGATWASNDGVGGNFTTTDGGATFVSAYPAATSDVFFTNSGAVTNTLGAGFDIKSLTFSGAGTTSINSDSNILTIESGGLAVQSGAGAVSIAATVAGPGAVTNADTLTLSGPNTYTGGTTNTSGTLTAGSATAFGTSTGALAVNGGTVDLNGNSISIGLLSGSGGSITNNSSSTNVTLTESNSSTTTFAGALNNGGNGKTLGLTKNGTGMLVLNGTGTYSGATLVSAGTIQTGTSTSLGTSAATVSSGATIDLNGQTISNALTILGTGVGGNGALINSNTGAAAAVSVDIAPSNSFTIGGAGDINLQRVGSANTGSFTLTMAGTGTVTTSGAGYNNLMSLVVNSGTFVLANTSGEAIDRNLTINNGTVRLSGSNTDLISDGNNGFAINGGAFDLNGHNESVATVTGTGGVIENLSSSTTSTLSIGIAGISGTTTGAYSGTIQNNSGSGGILAITKIGGGIQTLSGANTYTGATTVSAGTLQAGVASVANTSGAFGNNSAVTLANVAGAILDLNGFNTQIGSLTGGGATGGNVTLGSVTLTVGGDGTSPAVYAGVISGTGGTLVKTGSGTLTLSGANSYTGGTTISAGTISQTGGALGTGTITLGDGSTSASATLVGAVGTTLTNTNPITIASGGSGTYTIKNTSGSDYNFSGTIALNNAATFATTGNGAMFLSGQITGSPLITIDGGGTTTKFVSLNTSSAGTFTGNILVQNKGELKFGNSASNALSTSTTLTLDATSSMDTGLLSETFAGVNDVVTGAGGSAIINAQSGTNLTLGGSGTYSYSGAISGNGGLIKSGSGTQTLAGTNTYTGNTTVNSGTLELSSSGGLRFVPTTNGVSNKITGTGTVSLKGTFNIDTSGANLTNGNTWTLVNSATLPTTTFDATTFAVAGYTKSGSVWTKVSGANTWSFSQATGVLSLSVSAGYSSWATLKGLDGTNNGLLQDPNNNGISNLMEYVLNGDPKNGESPASILPTQSISGTNLVFDFHRLNQSASDTTQVFEYGSDLSGWTDVAITAGTFGGVTIAVTADSPAAGIDHVVVTVPMGANTKLFGRLKVTKP